MSKLKSQDLKQRIAIQHQVSAKDPTTKETKLTWVDFVANLPAAIAPLKGREYFQAKETHAENTIKIRIRYRAGITSDMRVLYGTRILYIQGDPIDPDEQHWELQLMCAENKPAGPGED
jgi:SPP1 family predicted phage head-tail adaptor